MRRISSVKEIQVFYPEQSEVHSFEENAFLTKNVVQISTVKHWEEGVLFQHLCFVLWWWFIMLSEEAIPSLLLLLLWCPNSIHLLVVICLKLSAYVFLLCFELYWDNVQKRINRIIWSTVQASCPGVDDQAICQMTCPQHAFKSTKHWGSVGTAGAHKVRVSVLCADRDTIIG